MVNWGLNRANQKSRIKRKEARKIKVDVEIQTGVQLHKITNLYPIGGAFKTITN